MSKITDSLQMTVIMGFVLTIVMVLAAPMIAGSGGHYEDAAGKATTDVVEESKGE